MEKPLTVTEAAAVLGVSRGRVHALIKAKRIPFERLGVQFFIKRKDLAAVRVRRPGRPKKTSK